MERFERRVERSDILLPSAQLGVLLRHDFESRHQLTQAPNEALEDPRSIRARSRLSVAEKEGREKVLQIRLLESVTLFDFDRNKLFRPRDSQSTVEYTLERHLTLQNDGKRQVREMTLAPSKKSNLRGGQNRIPTERFRRDSQDTLVR